MTRDEKFQKFGEGPWLDEPDREEFEHAGHPCLIRRHEFLGTWCGYVAVAPGHPLHGQTGDELDKLGAHGGVNYASKCEGDVCHVPKPGEPDDVWWFGFDCAHCWDLAPKTAMTEPGIAALYERFGVPADRRMRSEYRDVEYVRDQVKNLAEQLHAMVASAA